jgi:hypothetical protein
VGVAQLKYALGLLQKARHSARHGASCPVTLFQLQAEARQAYHKIWDTFTASINELPYRVSQRKFSTNPHRSFALKSFPSDCTLVSEQAQSAFQFFQAANRAAYVPTLKNTPALNRPHSRSRAIIHGADTKFILHPRTLFVAVRNMAGLFLHSEPL